mmetsp:Transcript_53110/g.128951  ORF Transcript_53110/g.128951 Transcript_53110/m.128951 type:complete len:90 (-) Transcript_53110:1764-2033(-)
MNIFRIANRLHALASSSRLLWSRRVVGRSFKKSVETNYDRASNKSKLAASALLFKFALLDEVLPSAEHPMSSELFLSEMMLRLRCSLGI